MKGPKLYLPGIKCAKGISENCSGGKMMNKDKFLTPNQIVLTLVGFFIGSEYILYPK
jgi:hypothetical protein